MSLLKKWLGKNSVPVPVPVPVPAPAVQQAEQKPVAGQAQANPGKVGMRDANRSGWYQGQTGELLKGFPISAEDVVLDVGCGEGLATLFCARQGAHVVFSDVDAAKIESLRQRAEETDARRVEAYVSDSLPLPIADEYATRIMAMEMLEHTERPDQILKELVRVGKPGARYLITVPDSRSENLQKPFADASYFAPPNHIQIYDKEQFCRLVGDAGLIIEDYQSWGFYWTMWMSIFWNIPTEPGTAPGASVTAPPYHPALQHWANTWHAVMQLPNGQAMMDEFNKVLPKAQAIIARKPA